IEEVRRQHFLAVHSAIGGEWNVEFPFEQSFEQPHAEIGVDLVDIRLALIPICHVLRDAAWRRLISILALVFPVCRPGDLLDRVRVGDATAVGLLSEQQRERRIAPELEPRNDRRGSPGWYRRWRARPARAARTCVATLLHVTLVL